MLSKRSAFTIVELLIVIVVIGILATIAIVAYNGIQDRARVSSVSSALNQAAKKIALWQVDNPSSSPTDLASVGVSNSSDVSYQYTAGTNGAYCITATNGTTSYYLNTTTATKPTTGGCAGHGVGGVGAVTNMIDNPSFETTPIGNAGAGGTTRTVSSTQKISGNNSSKVVWTSGSSGVQFDVPSVVQNTTYFISMYIFLESGTVPQMRITAQDYVTNNVILGNTATTGQWVRYTNIYTTVSGQSTIRVWGTAGSAGTYYIDGVMVVQGNQQYNYADGNSPNWIWNGTVNNSTSTGPPL